MDGWVSVRIWRTQGVSYNKSLVDPVQTGWGTIPLPSSFSSCSELGLSHSKRKGTEACLLHQQSFKRSWRKIPPLIEKLAFSLITTIRKLRPYFQAHIINVLTDHPLKKATNKLEAVGRLIQWAIELSEFNIRYQPKEAIKAPALADFIAEFTSTHD